MTTLETGTTCPSDTLAVHQELQRCSCPLTYDLISETFPKGTTEQFPPSLCLWGQHAALLTSSQAQSLSENYRLTMAPQCRPRRGRVLPPPWWAQQLCPGTHARWSMTISAILVAPRARKSPFHNFKGNLIGCPPKGLFLITFRTGVCTGAQGIPVELLLCLLKIKST